MLKHLFTAAFCGWLAGCASGIYKVTVQQGNLVTQKMLDQVKPGMTTTQVRYIMGQPIIQPLKKTNEWLYLYRRERGDQIQNYRLKIHFDDQSLFTHYSGATPQDLKLKHRNEEDADPAEEDTNS